MRRMTILGSAMRLILCAVVLTLVLLPRAAPVHAAGGLLAWSEEGVSFTTFGPNDLITIDTGTIEFINNCPSGVDDSFLATGDVYIVPAGSVTVGDHLSDVANAPNTIQAAGGGLFIDELIGITPPGGRIGPGRYAVVYDECQDGILDASDEVFDPAFEVVIPDPNVPPLPSIAALKADATAEQQHWKQTHDHYQKLFEALEALGELQESDFIDEILEQVEEFFAQLTGVDVQEAVLTEILNTARHYQGLAADPPDPNFQQLTPLGARARLDPQSTDPLFAAAVGVGSAASNEDAILRALLASIERYQGAAAGQSGTWALSHARAIRQYAGMLATQLAQTNAALAAMSNALSSDPRPLDAAFADLEAFRGRVATSGFAPDEVVLMQRLGLTAAQIEQLRTHLATEDFAVTKADLLSNLTALQTTNTALSTDLGNLSSSMDTLIATLQADPLVADQAPHADAGGPYTGTAGTALGFNGAQSTSPARITGYAWDLQGSGAFTDASGPTPTFTYHAGFAGWVGLKVTNTAGLANVAYAPITVASASAPPTITGSSPSPVTALVVVGDAQTFSVSASAPNGHALNTQWFVDRQAAASGDHFSYAPTPAEVGVHSVEVLVSDTSSGGRAIRLDWVVGVLSAAVRTDPPTVLPSIAPHPNAGWNNTDVMVTWSLSDLYSGVANSNGCATTVMTAETTGTTLTCSATNGLGLSQAQSVTVRIDKTAPTTTATPSRPVNGTITVALSAADSPGGSSVQAIRYFLKGAQTGAGVVTGSSGSVTIAAQGTSYLVYSATDVAGNREPLKVLTIHNETAAADYVVADGFAVSLFATGFATGSQPWGTFGPIGVAFDSANNLFVMDAGDGYLYKFGSAGGAASVATRVGGTAATPIGGLPWGLTFSRSGRLYLSRLNAGDVLELNPATGAVVRTVATGLGCAIGIATDPLSGDLFVSQSGCGPQIFRISNFEPGPATVSVYASPASTDGLTFGPDGTLYTAAFDASGNFVMKITGTNKPAPPIATRIAYVPTVDGTAVAASSDTSTPPFLFGNRNDGKITRIDLTANPLALADIVSNGTRGDFAAVGPDGCLYATQTATILKVTSADGTCNLAPSASLPQLQLAPQSAAHEVGTSHNVTASLRNVSAPAGVAVTFTVSGAHTQSATVPTDASGQATFSYSGSVEGIDQVVATASVTGKSVTSNPATVTWVSAAPDTLPPSTVATATPTPNAFGWNNTDVTIQLSAVDNPGGSGVKEIHYALTGAQSTSASVAGSSAVVPVTAEGLTTLAYFAIDNAGNQEPPQSLTVRIDKTEPASTAIHLPSATPAGWNNTAVTVRVGAADTPGGSGVRDIQSTLSGAQTGGATVTGSFAPVTVSAEGITTVAYAATDRAGNQEAAGNVTVRIDMSAPTTTVAASPAANAAGWNNTDVLVSLSAQDSQGGSGVQQISYAMSGAQAGAGVVAGGSGSVTLATPGVTTISAFATDNAGNTGSVQTRTVRIDETPPTVFARPAPLPDARGHNTTPVTVSLHGVDGGGSGVKELHYTLSGAQVGDSVVAGGHTSVTISALGTTTIRVLATDNAGNTGPASVTMVTIIPPDTTPPVTTNVAAAPNPAAVTTPVSLTATVSDVATGGSNIASAEYALDGGSFSAMAAQDGAFDSPTELVTVNIAAFPTAGVHNLCVRGTDVAGNVGSQQCVLLAVYDPSSGFVTGGGWIDSPAGACQISAVCQGAVGRANFGFVAKYQRGATVPTGQTEFQFQAGNLNFHAESYQWLVVSGAKAQYKGTGTINGSGTYGFMLSAIDGALPGGGGADKFRIKITDSSGNVVYDNQLGGADSADPTTVIAGGNIVIHSS